MSIFDGIRRFCGSRIAISWTKSFFHSVPELALAAHRHSMESCERCPTCCAQRCRRGTFAPARLERPYSETNGAKAQLGSDRASADSPARNRGAACQFSDARSNEKLWDHP